MDKRLATKDETERQLGLEQARHPTADIYNLHREALGEGYEDEVCPKCGIIFLAHHHMTDCPELDCPMKDGSGKSLLELMFGEA